MADLRDAETRTNRKTGRTLASPIPRSSFVAHPSAKFGARLQTMTLTYGLRSARDLLGKLKRDAALLDQGVTSDKFFNFVVTGYSIIDWVKHDPSISPSARSAVEKLNGDRWIKVCGDLANASKHFVLTKRKPITSSAESDQGERETRNIGNFPWGFSEYTKIEPAESITIELEDGSSFSCLELVKNVIETWSKFFSAHQL